MILLAGLIAYANSFSGALVFDDRGSIAENHSIRQLSSALLPPNQSGVGGRPLANLSFAFNYAISGPELWSYHLLNLVIHLSAAIVLFAIVRRTLLQPLLQKRFGADAPALALAVAVLWTIHPVQTQVVTYLSQRTEALMGLFYLLTLYAFIRATLPEAEKSRRRWLALAAVSCLLGALCKEIIVTAPVMVLLYDRTFVAGTFREAWSRRWRFYLLLATTWIVLGCLMLGLQSRGVGYGRGVSAFEYALTESRAILLYLRVAVWPHPLVFDYGMEVFRRVAQALPYLFILVPLLVGTLVALRRKPALGFAACWFFVVLSPTSSFVPVVQQPIAESRLYLPLAAVLTVAVLGLHALMGRRGLLVWLAAAVVLGSLTIQRNGYYRSEEVFWIEAAAERPRNARAHNNLGAVIFKDGRVAEAIACFETAVRLSPDYASARMNLAGALFGHKRFLEALEHVEAAVRLMPENAEAHRLLGLTLIQVDRFEEAVGRFEQVLKLRPESTEARTILNDLRAVQEAERAQAGSGQR